MKNLVNIISCFVIMLFGLSASAQDTIAAWTFPAASADSLVDVSIPLNSSRYISCQYGTWASPSYHGITSYYMVTGADGGADKCASASGFDNGSDSVYWMIKFKSTGYQNLTLSSKQYSSDVVPGPKDFIIQYKLPGSSSPWVDLVSNITCAANWTSAAVSGVTLPAACDNQSGQISVRWLQVSNLDVNGNTLLATGVSMIDDIVITGDAMSGIATDPAVPALLIYPNPCSGSFLIRNAEAGSLISVYNVKGSCIFADKRLEHRETGIHGLAQGIYYVRIVDAEHKITNFALMVK